MNKKKSKTIVSIILIIVLVVLLGVGGYFISSQMKKKPSVPENTASTVDAVEYKVYTKDECPPIGPENAFKKGESSFWIREDNIDASLAENNVRAATDVLSTYLKRVWNFDENTSDYTDELHSKYIYENSIYSNEDLNYWKVLNKLDTKSQYLGFEPRIAEILPDQTITSYGIAGYTKVRISNDMLEEDVYDIYTRVTMAYVDGQWEIGSVYFGKTFYNNTSDIYYAAKDKCDCTGNSVITWDFANPTGFLTGYMYGNDSEYLE